MRPPTPRSTLFPYTTLFRSLIDVEIKWSTISFQGRPASLVMANDITERKRVEHRDSVLSMLGQSLSSATSPQEAANIRSEEHTSELQSRGHLVCRLLLEKKK